MPVGGESIRDMQNQTGCKINVSPATGRDVEREIGLIGSRHAIDAAKRAIMEKVDTVVSCPELFSHGIPLTASSVLALRVVKLAMTMWTDIQHNRQVILVVGCPPLSRLCRPSHSNRLFHPRLRVRQIRMLLMAATKTIFRCGTRRLRRTNNKVFQVKVSNDKARGVDCDLARDCGLCASAG